MLGLKRIKESVYEGIRVKLYLKMTVGKGILMKKRIIPVLVAIILIIIICGGLVFTYFHEKYSYSTVEADLGEYFGVSGEELAIILQSQRISERAVNKDGVCYFDLDTVHTYFNEIFYVDEGEQKILYTDALGTMQTAIGSKEYADREGTHQTDYTISYTENGKLYLAADFVKLYTNFAYDMYDKRVLITAKSFDYQGADVKKDTQIRVKGGIKSDVLCQLHKGDTVEILEKMETWSKVKSKDGIIGYTENKFLEDERTISVEVAQDYVAPQYTGAGMDKKVCLGFHSIGGPLGNDTLMSMLAEGKGMNVIAPTWYSLNDNEGGFRSFSDAAYVERAHTYGLEVWGVWDNFNYANEEKTSIDLLTVLSQTAKRQKLAKSMVEEAKRISLDGINIDFEQLSSEVGIYYVQFLRELSVLCREAKITLSIDNYVPFNFNEFYRLDIQGQVADYVIIMGYDEHWHGSKDPGSVASIDYVTNGITKTLEKVPAQKVVNALPFYTIVWCTDGAAVTDEYLTMNNVADYIQRHNLTPEWDELTCQNYAEWESGGKTYSVWFEEANSISSKLNVMNAKQIGGVAVWRLGYGTEAVWDLLNLYVNK